MTKEKILVVDDDQMIKELFDNYFSHNFEVKYLFSGSDIVEEILKFEPVLILLDINLPNENGFHLCSKLQKHPTIKYIPKFFISSRKDLSDKISGFNLGAEDYIEKPFEPLELEARMISKINHYHLMSHKQSLLKFNNLVIDTSKNKVYFTDINEKVRILDLTKIEYKFLTYLVQNQNKILSRDEIINNVWGENIKITNRSVDVYATYLRKKAPMLQNSIKAVYGGGYCLRNEA